MRVLSLSLILLLSAVLLAHAGRTDTVFFEDLTFDEIRDLIKGGAKGVIIATGGTEDGGAQIAVGRHTDIITYTADKIARSLGDTLVAPVIAYAPGSFVPVQDDKGYVELLQAAANSMKGSGFNNIYLIGDSAGSQGALKSVADKLDAAWKNGGVRVFYISDYYIKSRTEQDRYAVEKLGLRPADSLGRTSLVDTSELMAINTQRIRLEKLENGAPTPQLGQTFLKIKIDNAVAQIKQLQDRPAAANPQLLTQGKQRVAPTPDPRTASGTSLFLEDLTASEIRDAIAGGSTVAIIPTGGTEKNGFHMALGKHNFHVRAGAQLMATKLDNALIAPVLQYVPESQATEAAPGVLSCSGDCFEHVVEAVARGLKLLGFKDILLVGDNGGNQAPLGNVANRLNREWEGSDARAFALTDFYDKGHEYQDAWFLGQFGWDASVVGSHAGIKDTSQMLYVKPQDVRKDRIADSFNNKEASGISGDPTKATAEFGRVAIEFKANGAIAQYRALKVPPPSTAGGRVGGRNDR